MYILSCPFSSADREVLVTFLFSHSLSPSLESAINFGDGCSSTPVSNLVSVRPRTIFPASPFSARFWRLKRAKEDLYIVMEGPLSRTRGPCAVTFSWKSAHPLLKHGQSTDDVRTDGRVGLFHQHTWYEKSHGFYPFYQLLMWTRGKIP